ncbi:hypothetical protein G4B88_026405 [Cannabis sativa]|uniref:DUF4283 domain-containing protein n=1 Tax=Cannabis sativa TaxID=3483 RepID=A0A7J6FYL5_CANSA|nr:hypothetical protein G4B88_026405 [Cannabis sativa]
MASPSNNRDFDNLTLEDEEEIGISIEDNGGPEEIEFVYDPQLCLVGKFIVNGAVDFLSMQQTLPALWKPGRGVYIKELGANLYLFQFYHEIDIKRVCEGSPWVGNYIGTFVESCPKNFNGIWREYMRIRTKLIGAQWLQNGIDGHGDIGSSTIHSRPQGTAVPLTEGGGQRVDNRGQGRVNLAPDIQGINVDGDDRGHDNGEDLSQSGQAVLQQS